MNRKQKKAKRLKAQAHTKKQAQINITPHEEVLIKDCVQHQERINQSFDEHWGLCSVAQKRQRMISCGFWVFVVIAFIWLVVTWSIK